MSGKTALIVFAHQERTSFNYAMFKAAQTTLEKKGWTVLVSDLYEMKFNAVLSRDDIRGEPKEPSDFKYTVETLIAWKEGRLAKDIEEEHKKVAQADLVIFQFPMYWNGQPAIMRGWIERVFSAGFAHDAQTKYYNGPFKNKKALLSFTTGGRQPMLTARGVTGDINVILWPIQHKAQLLYKMLDVLKGPMFPSILVRIKDGPSLCCLFQWTLSVPKELELVAKNGILNCCGFKVLPPQISYAVALVTQEARVEMLKDWEKRLETIWDEKPIRFLTIQDFEDRSGGLGYVLKKEVEEARSADKYGPTVGQNLGKPLPPDSQLKSEN